MNLSSSPSFEVSSTAPLGLSTTRPTVHEGKSISYDKNNHIEEEIHDTSLLFVSAILPTII